MLYYLFEHLQSAYDFPGAGLFQYGKRIDAGALRATAGKLPGRPARALRRLTSHVWYPSVPR